MCGLTSGILEALVNQPFEATKIRMQAMPPDGSARAVRFPLSTDLCVANLCDCEALCLRDMPLAFFGEYCDSGTFQPWHLTVAMSLTLRDNFNGATATAVKRD
jgi:transmembrane carrier protein